MTCPTCQKQVISGVPTCQFCGSDLRGMAPAQAKRSIFIDSDSYDVVHTGGKPGWVVPAYYIVCGYFVLTGVLRAILTLSNHRLMTEGGPLIYVSFAFDALSILFGLGLMLKIEVIRGIVNFVCGISLIFGLFGLLGSLGSVLTLGGLGVLFLIQNVLDICTNGFMMYLIGETD